MIKRDFTFRIRIPAVAVFCALSIPAASGQAAPAAQVVVPADTVDTSTSPMSSPLLVVAGSPYLSTQERGFGALALLIPKCSDSMTSSPNQIIITSKTPGAPSLVLWDEDWHTRS